MDGALETFLSLEDAICDFQEKMSGQRLMRQAQEHGIYGPGGHTGWALKSHKWIM